MKSIYFKLFIVLFQFIYAQTIFGQTLDKRISPNDYYEFFNSFIKGDSIHTFNLESNPELNEILRDTLSIFNDTALFSVTDIQFIKAQLKTGQKFKWKSNGILGSNVISSKKIARIFKSGVDEGWAEFNSKYTNGFATYSVPLFSSDKTICIVYKAKRCGGLCGHGGTSVYKKVNGKWTFLKSIGMIWVS